MREEYKITYLIRDTYKETSCFHDKELTRELSFYVYTLLFVLARGKLYGILFIHEKLNNFSVARNT